MIVSSTSELRLLKVLARRRIDELGLNVPADRLDTAADRVIRDALAVSGDIVCGRRSVAFPLERCWG